MRIRDFLEPATIRIPLQASTRDGAFAELVGSLELGDRATATVVRQLQRRETLGSTGFGAGVAIPHCRTLAVSRLRMAFGHSPAGIPWGALDGQLVHAVFLIAAPPSEVSNQYLQVLGRVAQFVHDPEIPPLLRHLTSAPDFLALLEGNPS